MYLLKKVSKLTYPLLSCSVEHEIQLQVGEVPSVISPTQRTEDVPQLATTVATYTMGATEADQLSSILEADRASIDEATNLPCVENTVCIPDEVVLSLLADTSIR